jgi:drug/metabolite transporter (DMT)-like permease
MTIEVSVRNDRREGHALGMVVMACGVMLLPVMDAIAKYLAAGGMAPGQIAFYRFFFQVLETVPVIVALRGFRALRPKRLWLNLVRGCLLGGASLCFFTAVKFLPLAEAIAIFFVEPFILTILSAVILGERVARGVWMAIVVGFFGALIVINPSFSHYGPVALLPLGAATLFATYLLMNRALGVSDSPIIMQYAAGVGGSVFLGGILAVNGVAYGVADLMPSLPHSYGTWALILALGGIAAYGHLLIVWAFQHTPAAVLAPFQYLEIVSATLAGYLVFAHVPTPSSLLGIAVIVGAGLYMFWRERN